MADGLGETKFVLKMIVEDEGGPMASRYWRPRSHITGGKWYDAHARARRVAEKQDVMQPRVPTSAANRGKAR